MKRRDFIMTVAASAGATYAAMKALDLLEQPVVAQQSKGPFQLQGSGQGRRIVILGAGLAGMCSAYELSKIGYDCIVLEATSRAGGRCWTIRGGDQFSEIDGQAQTCQFDQGLYLNPGPARIPQHHVTIDYCKELGVPLEVIANTNRQQYYYNVNAGPLSGRKVRQCEAVTDIRGYISELLVKCVSQDLLDTPLTTEDKERLIAFLRTYGDLNPDLFYKGSRRRGDVIPRGAGDTPGQSEDPFDLSALLQLGFTSYEVFEWDYLQQATMLQPVGGIDQIAKAFEREVQQKIRYQSEVKEIRKTPNGVRIVYADGSGNLQQETADYCICTIPLTVLRNIASDFSPDLKEAIAGVAYTVTGKSGLQFNRRFWEEDEDIFGGITNSNQDIVNQIWYPSYGYLEQKGILNGYYTTGTPGATRLGNLPPSERVALALEQGSNIHPQYRNHFENGVAVFWPKVPYQLGGWANYTTQTRQQYYPRLNEPDGNIYLSGEHLSYITGWMAGAFESARVVTAAINARVQQGTGPVPEVPSPAQGDQIPAGSEPSAPGAPGGPASTSTN